MSTETMNIGTFKGRKYDIEKVLKYNKRVDKKIENVEKNNSKRWARYYEMFKNDKNGIQPQYFHEIGFCTFCGAVRPSGEIGIGCGCEQIVKKFLEGYIKEFVEVPQQYKDDYLNAYKKYARFARALYLYHNTKKGDMKTVKAFKNEFKKSFTQSMIDNVECRISRKQLDIIEKDAEYRRMEVGYRTYVEIGNNYEEQLEKYRKYVFRKFYFQKGYGDFKQKIFNSMEFGLYCRIQVTNAWL